MDERGHQQIDPAVLRLARFKGRQLAGKYGFARHDADEIQQELILDYLCRVRSFDPSRSHHRLTFARLVVNNRVRTLIQAQKSACRDYVCRLSLDQPFNCQDEPYSPQAGHIAADVATVRDSRSVELKLNRRLDVQRVLDRLPATLLNICNLVMLYDSAIDVALRAGISRATLYRRLGQVRAAFVEAGMDG